MNEAAGYFEMSVPVCLTAWHHIQEDYKLNITVLCISCITLYIKFHYPSSTLSLMHLLTDLIVYINIALTDISAAVYNRKVTTSEDSFMIITDHK